MPADVRPCVVPVAAAARYLSVSRSTVVRLIRRRTLPVVRLGRAVRVRVADLDRLVALGGA
jgi:excisionase family DNA binding protein